MNGHPAQIESAERDPDSTNLSEQRIQWMKSLSGYFSSIGFSDGSIGVVGGPSQTYWLTENGGVTWNEYSAPKPPGITEFEDYDFVNARISRAGTLILVGHSENAGSALYIASRPYETWQIENANGSINDVAFVGNEYVWIVGNDEKGGFVLKLRLGGGLEEVMRGDELTFAGIAFVDDQTGWIVGGHGAVARTRDGGQHWEMQASPTDENLLSVSFANANYGFAVGVNGIILQTSNGGQDWIVQDGGAKSILTKVLTVSSSDAWIVGLNRTLLHTVDSGRTWRYVNSFLREEENPAYLLLDLAIRGDEVWLVTNEALIRSEKK